MSKPNTAQPRRPRGAKGGGQFAAKAAPDAAPGSGDGLTLKPDGGGAEHYVAVPPRLEWRNYSGSGDDRTERAHARLPAGLSICYHRAEAVVEPYVRGGFMWKVSRYHWPAGADREDLESLLDLGFAATRDEAKRCCQTAADDIALGDELGWWAEVARSQQDLNPATE